MAASAPERAALSFGKKSYSNLSAAHRTDIEKPDHQRKSLKDACALTIILASRRYKHGKTQKGVSCPKGLVALVALVSVGVLGYFTFMVVDEQSNAQFEEGTHFETLATPRRVRGDAIEVMEFFSYGCVHCFRLEDQLEDWQASIDEGVKFVKRPLIGSDAWRILGQHFHTLESLEASPELHRITFSAIHNGLRRFESGEELAAFIEDNSNIDAQTYLSHWNSPEWLQSSRCLIG